LHNESTGAFALIESLLAETRLSREEIDCLAIGLGPGSYAGIRVSLAIAQGWQLARAVRTTGVSSVEAMAWTAQAAAHRGRVSLVVDAQRNEFYLAVYELADEEAVGIEPLRIVSRSEIERRIQAGDQVFGPDLAKVLPGAGELYPDAAVIAKLAGQRQAFVPAEKLEPIYLRAANFVKAPKPVRSY
jgi:tRNA threonylcarbamoyl adenosine modification protein YeaZ